MYEHLLIATDGSEFADRALAHGLFIAKGLGGRVTVVTIIEQGAAAPGDLGLAMAIAFPSSEYERAGEARAATVLETAASAAAAAGVPCETLLVKNRPPAEAIIEAAAARGCDAVVMASHGRRGLSRLILGSQTNHVLSHSTLPVIVVR